MAGKVIFMGNLKQLLLMHRNGVSNRSIALRLGLDKGTVNGYVNKIKANNLDIDKLLLLDDNLLYGYFFSGTSAYCREEYSSFSKLLPYFAQELNRNHVTRRLLWEEYFTNNPNGYRYTQFCHHLQQYLSSKRGSMILPHLPCGELYVDFAGDQFEYTDGMTNTTNKVQVLVACMPYSSYTFVHAVASQRSEDFLYAIECCLKHLGGVPPVLVTDNLKSAVIKSDRYEPELNRTLVDFANHNGMVVRPTRPYKPKDKAQVEGAVKIVYNRIYAKLRNQRFFSLDELNAALHQKTREHNQTRMQQKDYSREEKFLSDECPLLTPLPEKAFEIKHYSTLRVMPNAHVFLSRDKHYYSVPYHYAGMKVSVIYTRTVVKIYCSGKIIAAHPRCVKVGSTTINEHLSPKYRYYIAKDREYYLSSAREQSVLFERYMARLFERSLPPNTWYKTCEWLLALSKKTSVDIFEAACTMAIENNIFSYRFVKNIVAVLTANNICESLKYKSLPNTDENTRGSGYYV